MNPSAADSVNYYIGWSYFNLKILDSCYFFLSRIGSGPFYLKSAFYSAFSLAYQKKITESGNYLNTIDLHNDSLLGKVRNLQFAGIALLERDFTGYEKCAKNFTYNYYALSAEEKNFSDYSDRIKKIKRRSPVVAGLMSAVVPGAGKFYAGNKGQAMAAFITTAILGLSTAEIYYKQGYKNPNFYVFGSIFTIFYVGNIWGSSLSVKLAREHQYRELDDQILFDMHIPLRRIYN